MAQIFLSYAREDEPLARALAGALERCGWSVWWDRRIPHGQDFRRYIQSQLDAAACVVVLWSRASIESQFVRDEASEGLDGRLVPALIEEVKPPLGFRQLQTANLGNWRGNELDEEFVGFVRSIESFAPRSTSSSTAAPAAGAGLSPGPAPAPETAVEDPIPARTGLSAARLRLLAGVAAIAVMLAGVYWLQPSPSRTGEQGGAPDPREDSVLANETAELSKDPTRAVALYQKACEGGSPRGCNELGVRYWNGNGVPKDMARAVALYQKACERNSAAGCVNLALRYRDGEGVSKDLARAAALFQKGCDGGNSDGCSELGRRYLNGEGVSKDVARAAVLFQKACDGGSILGCYNVGSRYLNGEGVPKDAARAAALFRKACDGGHADACTSLGVLSEGR